MRAALLATVLVVAGGGCSAGVSPVTPAETAPLEQGGATGEFREAPEDRSGDRVELFHLAPAELVHIPRWGEEHFGAPMPARTYRPEDQGTLPLRWDRGEPRSHRGARRDQTFVTYHGHGCCGACQTVALLGATLAAHRIETGEPVPRSVSIPHRPRLSRREDELELAAIFAVSRQAFVSGGRDIPVVAPALAIIGAPTRADARPLLPQGRKTWLPSRLCRAFAGEGLPVLRARVREHDVRFMTVALEQGPVIISGAFNRLRRDDDGIYRCPRDATDQSRHHFMLVIGWETNDVDNDGEADEVVWLVRDDHERRGGDHDTWEDGYLDDEWGRIVPLGCLLDRGRAHSIIPGTVRAGTFDDPTLPGPEGPVSFCEADPDQDGVPTIRDTCPYFPDPEQVDTDGDDLGDLCDPCPEERSVNDDWPGHIDSDRDRTADACDSCPDDRENECEDTR